MSRCGTRARVARHLSAARFGWYGADGRLVAGLGELSGFSILATLGVWLPTLGLDAWYRVLGENRAAHCFRSKRAMVATGRCK